MTKRKRRKSEEGRSQVGKGVERKKEEKGRTKERQKGREKKRREVREGLNSQGREIGGASRKETKERIQSKSIISAFELLSWIPLDPAGSAGSRQELDPAGSLLSWIPLF